MCIQDEFQIQQKMFQIDLKTFQIKQKMCLKDFRQTSRFWWAPTDLYRNSSPYFFFLTPRSLTNMHAKFRQTPHRREGGRAGVDRYPIDMGGKVLSFMARYGLDLFKCINVA